jgi:predicted nucleotidyltransferase
MDQGSIHQQFTAALDALVDEIRQDASILAAILCGSLSHDTVWARSDIDLVLVTIDDRKGEKPDVALYADGVNVHAFLVPRAQFRMLVEGSVHQSFMHSLLAKGRLLYTLDETIADLCLRLRDNTALWILYAATPLAQLEVISARLLADREVIPQAMALNPVFFKTIYRDLLNTKKTRADVEAALEAVDAYVAERAPVVFGSLIEYLRQAGEARSCTEIEDHFKRHFDLGGMTTACEFLADQGIIGKAALPVRLTRKSHVEMQELAFFYMSKPS